MITVLTGFAAGTLHVLSGPDHLAALAPMAAADHGGATRLGFRWGLGHGLGAAGLGLLAVLGRGLIHVEAWSGAAEALVGVALVALGLWSWRTTTRAVPATVAAGRLDHGPHSGRAAFAFGMLHGAAGTGHILAVLPALALPTGLAAVYLGSYFLAAVASMTLFTAGLGRLSARGSGAQIRQLVLAASATAVVVGVWWVGAAVA